MKKSDSSATRSLLPPRVPGRPGDLFAQFLGRLAEEGQIGLAMEEAWLMAVSQEAPALMVAVASGLNLPPELPEDGLAAWAGTHAPCLGWSDGSKGYWLESGEEGPKPMPANLMRRLQKDREALGEERRKGLLVWIAFPGDGDNAYVWMAWRKRARLHKSEPAGFRFFQKTAGLALEMAAEKHQVEQQLSRSSAVSEIAQTVNAALDLDILLRLIILEVTKALHYEAGDIWLRDEKSQTLSLRASLGLSASARNALTGMQDAGGTVAGDDPEGYEDTAAFSRLPAPLAEEGLRSLVIAPLKAKNKLIGIMHLYGKSRRLFSGSARSLLRTWTNQAASAIESARMFEDTKRKAQELLALHEMAQIISETPHLKSALGQIVERVSTVLNVEKCWLMFLEERSQMLVAHPSAVGAVDEQLAALRIDARAAGVSSEVFRSGRPFYSNEAGQEPGVQAEFQGIFQLNNLMAMPLRSGERTLGVFLAANKRDRAAFTGNDVRFFRTLASEAAMIIQNANLFTQLRGSYRSFIQSVAEVLDQGHSRRVAGIAGMLAGQLRLSEEDIECIQVAGLLHDMGKGGDHARGLNHPEAGANLVAGIDFPWDVSALIQHHHARFDGQDAPDHLSGERIPLGSRIIAVADEVDHRLHAGEESRALDEMKRLAGTQFDPAVIAALEQAWEQVRRKL